MKLIKAYVRTNKIDEVYAALKEGGFCCMTFVECQGTGKYSDQKKKHISAKYPFAEAYKVVKVEIIAADEHLQEVVKLIKKGGRTGYPGDGIIVVSPVEEVEKVRTDEKGILAI